MGGYVRQKWVVALVQARMRSTRLPGKTLLKLGKNSLLEILVQRLRECKSLDEIIIATTKDPLDDAILAHSKQIGAKCFRGSENDVLDRFFNAAKDTDADVLVRITADNPLTDIDLVNQAVLALRNKHFDYSTTRKIILGLGSEAFTFLALKIAWENAQETYQREHVTPFFYEHPDIFRINYIQPPAYLARTDIRLTIDTEADWKLFQNLFQRFGDLTKVSLKEVITYLDANPAVKEINSQVKQKHYREV